MLYLANISDLPVDTEYRLLAENCEYWNGLSLIETKEPINGLQIAPDTFPNCVSTEPPEDCVVLWEIKKIPAQDMVLAAKAELVLQSLIASGKLSLEMIVALNQLLGGVKQKANVQDIELGQAATLQTLEIIERLKQGHSIELATQIEQALQAVQAVWEAN